MRSPGHNNVMRSQRALLQLVLRGDGEHRERLLEATDRLSVAADAGDTAALGAPSWRRDQYRSKSLVTCAMVLPLVSGTFV